jgi:hypothetical protein
MKSVKASEAPPIDKNKINYSWTLMVNFRPCVSKKRREKIAAEKNCIILSAIEMGAAENATYAVEKGRPELKDVAHHFMCCVFVPKDGRTRKVTLAEAIKHFESYKKEIFAVQMNGTAVTL